MKNSGIFRFFLYGLSVILIISVNLNTFSSFHDSQLFPVKGELGYKKRGNRYEGFYERKCSGSLEIVSLMYGRLTFDWHPSVVITVSSPYTKKTVNVRARALPLKTYYQMDSQIIPGAMLKWPINDVIYKAQLKPSFIGVFGWFTEGNKEIFVPLAATQHDHISTLFQRRVVLIVRSNVDVEKVICRFFQLRKPGDWQSVGDWNEIDSYVDAGRPLKIEIPSKLSGREVIIEIKAKPGNSGTWLPLKINVLL